MKAKHLKFPSKSIEWKILLLILMITIINYFDRSAISYAITPIQKAFGMGNEEFGMIAGAFGIGYMLMSFLAGFLVDRYGAVKIWAIAAFLWSIATVLNAFSVGFWSLFILRVILGLAEAIHFPALLKTITDWLNPYWRGKCVAIALLGVPLASVMGAPILSFLIYSYSWRVMFIVLGIVGVIWVILWALFFHKTTKTYQPFAHTEEKAEQLLHTDVDLDKKKILKKLFSSRFFIGNCINYFIFGYILFFALTWLPGYLQQTFGVNILKTGGLVVVPWASAAIFLFLGGWISDIVWKKTKSVRKARVYPIGVGIFLSGFCFLGTAIATSLELDLFLLSLGLGFAFFVNSPIYGINADLFKKNAGTAQGVMTAFLALAGILSPVITGWLTQLTGNFNSAIYLIFVLCLISFFVSFFFQKEKERK